MSAAGHLLPPADGAALAAYRTWLAERWPVFRATKVAADSVHMIDEYVTLLPACTLARCPFCDTAVAESFDALSLNGLGWHEPSTGYGWLRGRRSVAPLALSCTHLRIVAWYLNLEGHLPDDLFPDKVIRTGPEVPSLMNVPMRADGAVAVIHPLPVGRWDDAEPAHHYTTWFVSYFTETRAAFDEATHDWGVHYGHVEYGDVDYDLEPYAARGTLRWLDGEGRLAPADAPYPYAGIDGDRSPERTLARDGVRHPSDGVIGRVRGFFRR